MTADAGDPLPGAVTAGASDRDRDRDRRGGRRRWLELGLLAGILVLAAILRLPGLDQRGQWDSDQGHDMAVLAALLHGQLPLLGPVTSVGTFHHGAAYYYLLAPAAIVAGADPVAITVEIALLGVAAVAGTWWLARLVGGPVAAALAALLLAVSPAGISESTFIWNPNPIPLFAALAIGGAIKGRRTGAARWWLLAALGTMATMQLHWLGGVLAVPVTAMWAWELLRRRRSGLGTSAHLRAGLAGALVLAAGYVPLAVHELTNDFSEVRALLAYLGGTGGGGAHAGIPERLVMVALRTLTWPVAGLVTDRPAASLAAMAIVVVLGVAALLPLWRRGRAGAKPAEADRSPSANPADADRWPSAKPADADRGPAASPAERWPAAWLVGTLAFSAVGLAILAPSLAVVTPGLPNDHYHAFLDPVVLALTGTGAARLALAARRAAVDLSWPGGRVTGPATAVVLTAALGAIAVTAWPPAVSTDGGWRLADAAAAHIVEVVDAGWPPDEPRLLVSLPVFKPDDAIRFPLARRGMALLPPVASLSSAGSLPIGVAVVVCDPLFDDATGVPCGGIAEDQWLSGAYPPSSMQLVERFRAGSRRVISIYAPSRLAAAP